MFLVEVNDSYEVARSGMKQQNLKLHAENVI